MKNTATIRKTLKTLRNSNLPDWMGSAMHIPINDGTSLEVFNAPSSGGQGYLIGTHIARRHDRRGNLIAIYKI